MGSVYCLLFVTNQFCILRLLLLLIKFSVVCVQLGLFLFLKCSLSRVMLNKARKKLLLVLMGESSSSKNYCAFILFIGVSHQLIHKSSQLLLEQSVLLTIDILVKLLLNHKNNLLILLNQAQVEFWFLYFKLFLHQVLHLDYSFHHHKKVQFFQVYKYYH